MMSLWKAGAGPERKRTGGTRGQRRGTRRQAGDIREEFREERVKTQPKTVRNGKAISQANVLR